MVVPRGSGDATTIRPSADTSAATELYCPFPLEENPESEQAENASRRWALDLGLVQEGPALEKLKETNIGLLEACVFPYAPLEMLTAATQWTTLFCAIDDFVESSHLGALSLSVELSRLKAAFDGHAGSADALGHAFHDMGRILRGVAGAPATRRFSRELERLFSSYIWEEINREHETEPDYDAYHVMRVVTIGLRPQFELLAALAPKKGPVPAAVSLLAELERSTCRIVGWANDIFTYEKELAQGEVHNLIMVLMRTEGLSVRGALARARSIHDEEVRSFLRLQARVRNAVPDDEATEHRLAHLRFWLRGHLHWALVNGRYRPPPAEVS